jgi:hypothetical protein
MVQVATAVAETGCDHPKAETAETTKAHLRVPKIDVNAILFRAVNECRSYEETRYYINGVYVHPHPEKGVLLIATDGHRLACAHDKSGTCDGDAIIEAHPRAFAGVAVDKKKPDVIPRLRLDADGHLLVGTYRSTRPALIDGTYPAYARVLAPMVKAIQSGTFTPASFNHKYLASFSKIAEIVSAGTRGMRVVSTSEVDAALILIDGAPNIFGALMPMRASMQNGMPAFMRPVLDPLMNPPAPPAAPVKASKPRRAPAKKKSKARAKKVAKKSSRRAA